MTEGGYDGKLKTRDSTYKKTEDLDLSGFFRVNPNDLVSSRIAILFSPQLLQESPVGQKVLQIVPRARGLPSEFRLSGNRRSMIFQWEDSP